nr:hypothetical protein [Tanacetum cinerariifolium]
SIKCAPFEMLYGRKCRAPIVWDQVGERVIEGPEMIEVTNEKVAVAKEKLKEARTKGPALFSIKLHHVGKFKELEKRKYVNGLVAYVDGLDIDKFFVHELNDVMVELGYVNDDPNYHHYMIPGTDLEIGLRALGNDLDVIGLAKSNVVIEEFPSSSMILKKRLLLKYHKPSSTPYVTSSPTTTVNPTPTSNTTAIVTPSPIPTCNPSPVVTLSHSPNATPSPSKSKFTNNSANRRKKNVNDIKPVPLPENVNVQDLEPLPANTDKNETVESIVQELMSMNYEFDPFEDNITASLNDQPTVNEQERARDDNNEPKETLVEGKTVAEDEEDSSTEEGDSDSEDNKDYFVDEDTYLEEVNVDMVDYHFNIEAEVKWVRHSNSRQEQDHDPIPVEKETTCSWTWFLECFSDDIGMNKESNFTFSSDRQKGLAIAMANVFPFAEHRYCLRHIHENIKKQRNGQVYKELLWRCVAATTVPYFDRAMEELKEFNKEAFEWLAKIPAHSYSRSHFSCNNSRAKSDILLNNLCECFNGKILDARDAPIITALEYIREYLMKRMVNVIVVINKIDGPLTPSATKLLKVAMDKANKYTIRFNRGESM